jgi:hypothetical protein
MTIVGGGGGISVHDTIIATREILRVCLDGIKIEKYLLFSE